MSSAPMSRGATTAVFLLAAAMFGWSAKQAVVATRGESPYLKKLRACEERVTHLEHDLEVRTAERQALVENEPACCYHGGEGMCLARGWEEAAQDITESNDNGGEP